MATSLNIQLTNELRRFVDERASDNDVYATPSEYVRDLIRRDMENRHRAEDEDVAKMLVESLNSPIKPWRKDFFDRERRALREQSSSRRKAPLLRKKAQ